MNLRQNDAKTGNENFLCVDTWTRTKDPHHVKVIL